MTTINGFELVTQREIPEISARVSQYRHVKTGADLISVETADENKCFGVAFKTPPDDATGLPHILEHSVLNGSRRYPVKEPFVELLKTSLNTFLNAFTFDDFTAYPVASTNVQDFYNLIDVYLDAVFFPLISEWTLKQEGWHYELESPDAPLTFKGVVFNEMKAAYSNPERVLDLVTQANLRPDTPYAVDSGGDPERIPDLTYAQFKAFHEKYYHPGNARFFFYGDDDVDTRLRMVDEVISQFSSRNIDVTVPLQPRFDEPRKVRAGYDAGEGGEEDRAFVTVNWLLGEVTNGREMLTLNVLDHILIETPASPLRKALIDSGLGEDLTGGGFSMYTREATFGTGLKGVAVENTGLVEQLVLDTLQSLAADGIAPAMIEAAINTTEFQLRERNTGQFPRGLMLFVSILSTWMHGGDAVEELSFEDDLNALKAAYAANPRLFERLIEQNFLNNPHRVTVVLEPDPEAGPAREARELQRLEAARAAMTPQDIEQILADGQTLKALQEREDSPEDLAKIPTLTLNDIEREARTIPIEVDQVDAAAVLYHDLPTSDIVYLDLAFDMHTLPQHLIPYMGLFGRLLLEMGTEKEDFVSLTQRIGSKTGGINAATLVTSRYRSTEGVVQAVIRAKCLPAQTVEMLAILQDILLSTQLDYPERFLQIVLEEKSQIETYIGFMGQSFAAKRVQAHLNEEGWVREQIGGVSYLFFLRSLAERVEQNWVSVLADLREILRLLVNRKTAIANVTVDADNWAVFKPQLAGFFNALPAADVARQEWTREPLPAFEALTAPAQVNFVAKGVNLFEHGYEPDGSIVAILKKLNFDYMWNRIRVQGGAYGGAAQFNHLNGALTFLSWRDPNLTGTLDNYDGTARYLHGLEMTDDELERAIIGAVGDVDQYQLPDAKGYTSLMRYLTGYSDDLRQRSRDQLLSTSMEDFHTLGEIINKAVPDGKVAVVTSPQTAQKVNESAARKLEITRVV
jgi:Zn-dependent M16 (insulinase) family peptidase